MKRARSGDVKAGALLLDRGWGKVKEHIDITSNEESINNNKIQIEIIKPKENDAEEDRN